MSRRPLSAASLCVVLCLFLSVARAQAPEPDSAPAATSAPASAFADLPIRDEAPVVVTGVQPGPGMWKVSKDGRTLWVLGTLSPLPAKMEWVSRDVEAVIAQADEVIWSPSLVFDADIGFFRGLLLMPRALKARRNPDGRTLREVLPADLYARWLPLKRKHLGRDEGVEQWRPLFAAMKLYEEALEDSGLRQGGVVGPVLMRAIKAHEVRQTRPEVRVVIEDPKAALDEFRGTSLDDMACFEQTLRRVEADLDRMRLRANAWATGDLATLRALPYEDQNESCVRATLQTDAVRKRVQRDLEAEMRTRWLEAAEKALAGNGVTFAVLPMRDLLRPDGLLATLQARGYTVEAPE
ncbi:TraB/GumN family protein [Vulcaniibacterium gelatinicum]|uniref:TraB/GumN family protein n=1 Tax=Vulcaniibacterium gelatinicum TaxID=2598725 RepID=UPI0011CC31FD|nr:TraB/GumN family protein [Vulcaniibacterium gelatinicum]